MLGAASFDGMDLRRDTGQTQAWDCSLVKSGRPRFVKGQLLVWRIGCQILFQIEELLESGCVALITRSFTGILGVDGNSGDDSESG